MSGTLVPTVMLLTTGTALPYARHAPAARKSNQSPCRAACPAAYPYYATVKADGSPWFELRTLFAQEMIKQGVLMPWLAVSYRHGPDELRKTKQALAHALGICAKGISEGIDKYLIGPAIKPVFRRYN